MGLFGPSRKEREEAAARWDQRAKAARGQEREAQQRGARWRGEAARTDRHADPAAGRALAAYADSDEWVARQNAQDAETTAAATRRRW